MFGVRSVFTAKRLSSSFLPRPSSFLALFAWLVFASLALAADNPKSRVFVVQDLDAIQNFDPDAHRVKQLVARGILAATGTQQPADAWRPFAGPKDVVGIKIVARGGSLFSVHKDLVAAIVDGLKVAGVPENNIIIWDKYQSDLIEAGWKLNDSGNGVRVVGVIPGIGFDPEVKYHSSIAGKIIWGDYLFGNKEEEISGDSHMARIVTQKITKLIDVSVLCHDLTAGLSGCLWNVAMGSVDNIRRFQNDASAAEFAIPDICAMPELRDKMVLHIMDGLLGQYALGPYFHPQYTWHHGAIYFSTDPVALDTVALTEIEAQRKRVGFPLVEEKAKYIQAAVNGGLGNSDLKKIDVVKIPR
jgi:hypothetical protein